MSHSGLIKTLGYAGTLPFLLPVYLMGQAFLSSKGLQSAALFGLYAPYVFIAYSAVILSFLSGTVWAYARSVDAVVSYGAILFSNLVALSAWLSMLLIYIAPIMTLFALCLLMAGYLGLLLIERLLEVPENAGYWHMRIQLTAVVALAHLAVILMMVAEL
ncbi:DUF3429 domain-containing protein [SAR92 clade bacterium H231]|nr:DUF3429 domain-containing protein [SAR92 clade bacterium H231]MDA7815914.1 DUF3429 domain-containing protein [Porticoccaceae bacterium]MDA8902877.1 DUF3429 domain-containing protein [Porticoccaceae bacterium]